MLEFLRELLPSRRQAVSFEQLIFRWPIWESLSSQLSIRDVQPLGCCSKRTRIVSQMEKDYRLLVFGKDLKQWFDQVDLLHDILRSSSAILSGAPVHKFLLPDVAEVVQNVEICVRNVDACRLLEYLQTQEQYEYVLEPLMWDFHCCKVRFKSCQSS